MFGPSSLENKHRDETLQCAFYNIVVLISGGFRPDKSDKTIREFRSTLKWLYWLTINLFINLLQIIFCVWFVNFGVDRGKFKLHCKL